MPICDLLHCVKKHFESPYNILINSRLLCLDFSVRQLNLTRTSLARQSTTLNTSPVSYITATDLNFHTHTDNCTLLHNTSSPLSVKDWLSGGTDMKGKEKEKLSGRKPGSCCTISPPLPHPSAFWLHSPLPVETQEMTWNRSRFYHTLTAYVYALSALCC